MSDSTTTYIQDKLFTSSKRLDFALGAGIAILSTFAFCACIVVVPILYLSFKFYRDFKDGLGFGLVTALCIIAFGMLMGSMYYLIHNGYLAL